MEYEDEGNNLLLGLAVRSKRTYELTSSIVPRGTSFHHWVEFEFPPIAFDPARYSRHCGFPGPPELGAVNPDAMHDHGQSTCQSQGHRERSTWRHVAACLNEAAHGGDTIDVTVPLQMVLSMEGVPYLPQ
jgi:hypothetical protein